MRICGINYDDPSLIAPWDPAHPDYTPPDRCGRCYGDGVIPCTDCGGESDEAGMLLVDGEMMHCEQQSCVDGLRECPRCDGSGVEV